MDVIKKTLSMDYEEALRRVPEALKLEGFGVLTEIDVKATLAKKLGVDFRRYKILGACNPTFAHRALEADLDVGVMLPCSIAVYELPEGGTMIAAIDPMQTIAAHAGGELAVVAREVRTRLENVIRAVGAPGEAVTRA